ncbi:MAG: hypothetical protein EOP48_19375 [Sphingobacteriales bacterium]|nr:MAG: hypothetical protein EOP48_19375 [Sphingobacteriales bacterium]
MDTSLVKACKTRIPVKRGLIMDGVTISTQLISNIDTNYLLFESPRFSTDSMGYSSTKYILYALKLAFDDNIVSEYLSDVETYIDESKLKKLDTNSELDRKRMKDYNWSVPDPTR